MTATNPLKHACLLILILSLGACSNLRFPGVYKIDVAQGNIVTQESLDKLQPGMTPSQVKFILGSPLIEDTFNEQRWDYYYSLKSGRTDETKTSHVSIYFDNQQYQRYTLTGKIRESSVRREAREEEEQRKKFLWIF